MNQPESNTDQPSLTPSPPGCLDRLVFISVWLWIVLVVSGRIISQLVASTAITMVPDAMWAIFPGIQSLLLLLPLLPLAVLWRSEPWRSIYRTWMFASFYVLLLTPVSLLFPGASQTQALLNITLSLIATFFMVAVVKRRRNMLPADATTSDRFLRVQNQPPSAAIALLVAAMFGIPWVLLGALGSLLDSVLGIFSGIAFGLVSAAGIYYLLVRGYASARSSPSRITLSAGFTAGVALLILSSGVGYPFAGIQLLMAVCIPSLGWLAVYFSWRAQKAVVQEKADLEASVMRNAILAVTLLIGLAAAFPQTFIDPDELALVISASSGEILTWALAAAAASAAIGFLSAAFLMLRLGTAPPASPPADKRPALRVAAALAWLVLLAVYFLAGQPGFFGEQLFVIIQEQADLSTIRQVPDHSLRRQQVYQSLVDQAQRTQADLRRDLSRVGIPYTPYYLVNGLEVQGGPLVKLWLEYRPEVDRVLYNPQMRPLPQEPPTSTGSQGAPTSPLWNLTQINANRVWQELGVTGEGILIGQSDSGVQFDHPELADSYRGRDGSSYNHDYSWFDPWNGTNAPVDIGGHGTHTLGSVLGDHTGVAPDAQWIACANLARNLGSPARYLDCMQFMLAPFPIGGDPFSDGDPARGADILNNSWGCPEIEGCDAQSLQPAVRALDTAGIFVVASAGNDGPFCGSLENPLAIYQDVYTVGAGDQSGSLALFSSRGPISFGTWVKPDIIAPGDQVLSSMPGSTYGVMSGTSMAGPHIAGTVALIWSANPDLIGDNLRTREILAQSAQPMQAYLSDCPGSADTPSTAIGYGLVDAYAAVQAALSSP